MTATNRRKANFKTVDLNAPVWVPKLNEMCEVNLAGFWVRCRVTKIEDADKSAPAVYHLEYESRRDSRLMSVKAFAATMREGKAPASKLDQLAVLMKTGKWNEALLFAAKFQDLGDHAKAITQGAAAITNADFYRQIKKGPAALIAAGVEALKARYVKV